MQSNKHIGYKLQIARHSTFTSNSQVKLRDEAFAAKVHPH